MEELLRDYVKVLIENRDGFEKASTVEEISQVAGKCAENLKRYHIGHMDIYRIACLKLLEDQIPVYIKLKKNRPSEISDLRELCMNRLNDHLISTWKYCSQINLKEEQARIEFLPQKGQK